MTLADVVSSTAEYSASPATDFWPEASPETLERHSQGAARCERVFSSHPLYAAKAAKDPEFWSHFFAGRVNW